MTDFLAEVKTNGIVSLQPLVVDAWYVGMIKDGFELGVDRDGVLAQYAGSGEFYAENSEEPLSMLDYDYLVKQL